MNIPESMLGELNAWNNGKGIDLEGWVACVGNFKLAVGYLSVFWPEFVIFEDYVLRKNFEVSSLRGFESQKDSTRKSVECVMNHLHIADLQFYGCEDLSKDKAILLGEKLKEMYQVKLACDFPDRECLVEFFQPQDSEDLIGYELTFWQAKHEQPDV